MANNFDWNKYQAEGTSGTGAFDWNKYESEAPKKESQTALAALEGFGEGATLGYLNNLQAAAEKPFTAAMNAITGNDVQADDYVTARDGYNKRQAELQKENPGAFGAGQVAGTIVSSMPVAKAAQGASVLARAGKAALSGAVYGGLQNTSEQEGELGGLDLGERTQNAAFGGLAGAGASLGADAVAKGIQKGAQALSRAKNTLGKSLRKNAGKIVENATGATRKQAENYREGTGEFLLDNELVGFGDNAEDIAEKAGKAISKAESKIDTSLKSLDEQGVTVSQDKIVEKLQNKIASLKEDSSQAGLVKSLQGIVDDIIETGKSDIKISAAEQSKRGFNTSSRMWDNPRGSVGKQADKAAYRAYKEAVEESATAANPTVAQTFKEGKSDFGLLNPVVDAAEKRAKQLNQMPWGGLLDTATVITGATQADDPLSGGVAGLATALARRKIAPRMASSVAVTMNNVSKRLLQNPEVARFAQVNPEAFNATVFGLIDELGIGGHQGALPKAADTTPTKGPEKWVNTGASKLNQAGISQDIIDSLRQSKKGRDLLIEASDASPNSKRMDSVLRRIRTAGGQ